MRLTNFALVLERLTSACASASLFALMLIVTADVLMRYLFSDPFVWSRDVVGLYLMPAAFFLVLSDCFRDGAMVRVEILYDLMPVRLRGITDAVGNLGAIVAFLLIGYGGAWQAWEAWEHAEVVAGSIPWPTWPSHVLVTVGCLLLVARLVTEVFKAVRAILQKTSDPSVAVHQEVAK